MWRVARAARAAEARRRVGANDDGRGDRPRGIFDAGPQSDHDSGKDERASKPGGGTGRLALDWWVPVDSPADLVAFADMSSSSIWLMSMRELEKYAQQQSSGRYHFYMYVDPGYRTRKTDRLSRAEDFEELLLERKAARVF